MSVRLYPAVSRSCLLSCLLLGASTVSQAAVWPFSSHSDEVASGRNVVAGAPEPLVIGQTFTIESKVLHETRRINVYAPPVCDDAKAAPCPVLYMPDGGIAEDFLHIAGLIEVSVGNGTMRPFILIGIENTERRRDLTPPTEVEDDKKIAAHVGGSAAFRQFIRDELKVAVRARFRAADESAIVGESLAGLFIVETFFVEPTLFDTYIAISPSLWWNAQSLAVNAPARFKVEPDLHKTLYLAMANPDSERPGTEVLAAALKSSAPAGLVWSFEMMPNETHGTIYHPAALAAFRKLFAPAPAAAP